MSRRPQLPWYDRAPDPGDAAFGLRWDFRPLAAGRFLVWPRHYKGRAWDCARDVADCRLLGRTVGVRLQIIRRVAAAIRDRGSRLSPAARMLTTGWTGFFPPFVFASDARHLGIVQVLDALRQLKKEGLPDDGDLLDLVDGDEIALLISEARVGGSVVSAGHLHAMRALDEASTDRNLPEAARRSAARILVQIRLALLGL